MLGGEVPDLLCTAFFNDVEWKALCCYVNETLSPPEAPPTMEGAIRMVGQLGRKGDGPMALRPSGEDCTGWKHPPKCRASFKKKVSHIPLPSKTALS